MAARDDAASSDGVGPVLVCGRLANAIVAAIQEENRGLRVLDHGAYVRLLAPERCAVGRAAIERHLGQPFRLPVDLESIMVSFQGELSLDSDQIVWSRRLAPR